MQISQIKSELHRFFPGNFSLFISFLSTDVFFDEKIDFVVKKE